MLQPKQGVVLHRAAARVKPDSALRRQIEKERLTLFLREAA